MRGPKVRSASADEIDSPFRPLTSHPLPLTSFPYWHLPHPQCAHAIQLDPLRIGPAHSGQTLMRFQVRGFLSVAAGGVGRGVVGACMGSSGSVSGYRRYPEDLYCAMMSPKSLSYSALRFLCCRHAGLMSLSWPASASAARCLTEAIQFISGPFAMPLFAKRCAMSPPLKSRTGWLSSISSSWT